MRRWSTSAGADRRSGRRRGDAGVQRRSGEAAPQPRRLSRIRTRQPGHRRRRGFKAHRRLPARHPARRHPRAIVGPRGSDRRQCAGRDLRRAREPCRLFPARAGHDALRRGQLHQPRHRQAAGHVGSAPGARRRRGERRQIRRRAEEEGRRARRLLRQPQQEGARGQDRSADRPRVRDQPHHPGAVPAAEEQSAVRRRGRRRQDRDRRRPGAPHRPWRGAGRAAQRHGVRARHGHAAWPARAIAATSRSGSSRSSRSSRPIPAPSCSSTRSTP